MCGCTNNTSGSNQCTILLIIVIFALQGLLNGSTQSKTALILLFLFWLCGNRGCNNACDQGNSCNMPMNNYCMPMNNCCHVPKSCCCKSKKKRCKDKDYCKCERVKVCYNSGTCCG